MTEEQTIPQAYLDAIEAIKASSPQSSVYVGCDSLRFKTKRKGQWFSRFSTVIVLHVDSKHGGKMFQYSTTMPDYGNRKARLMMEVQMALDAAMAIVEHIGDRRMELHLDINNDPKHASYCAYHEAMGWVKGMGFEPIMKPDSWAAKNAADHAVRNLH